MGVEIICRAGGGMLRDESSHLISGTSIEIIYRLDLLK